MGVPLLADRPSQFQTLVDKIIKRLHSWKSNLLSHAGRIVLIRSVIEAIAVYTMSTTVIPSSVLNRLAALVRRFFWGKLNVNRYVLLVARDKIAQPKETGGLGIRDLRCLN